MKPRIPQEDRHRTRGGCRWILGAVLSLTGPLAATPDEARHVEVQSLLGQRYDAVLAADDLDTFGLSIPRGTALPRRMYPVRTVGTPMIHRLRDPRFLDVLLRHPRRNHTEYLDPARDAAPLPEPPVDRPALDIGATPENGMVFSWPSSAGDWVLETTPTLNPDRMAWETIPPSRYRTDGKRTWYSETVFPSQARFFRLRQLERPGAFPSHTPGAGGPSRLRSAKVEGER